MRILRGFLKGTYFRPNSTFSTEWPINRVLAVEMPLRGRDDGALATTVLPALGAWKPAKDAGFHIPTATATAAVKLGQTAKPAPIGRFYRFSRRTGNFKHAKQRRLSRVNGSGGDGTDLAPTPGTFPRRACKVVE